MKNKIIDLIDFKKVNVLLEGFNKTTGFVTAILDLEGNVLSQSGWREICTQFHRVHPKTSKKCKISDTELAQELAQGEKYHFYKCLNGLVDVAIPIIINQEHIANLFTGQFFFEKPDYSFFKNQAKKYKFDEKIYLKAIDKVPVFSEKEVKTAMDFLLGMTELIVQLTYQQLEQKQAELTLKQNQSRLQKAERIGRMGNWVYEVSSGKIDWSAGMYAIYGRNKETDIVTYESIISWIHPEDRDRHNKYFEKMMALTTDTVPENLEYRIIMPNHKIKWVDVWFECEFDTEGNPAAFLGTVLDITKRKQAELNLVKNTNLLNNLIDNSSALIYIVDTKDRFISTNIQFEKLLGKTRNEIIGKERKEIIPIEIAKQHLLNDQKVIKTKQAISIEEKNKDADGIHYYQTHKFPLFDAENNIYAIGGISTDITEKKKAETELRESKSFFEQLFIQSSTSTQLLDKNGWCVKINPKLTELFGVLPEHIEGKKYNILKDDEIIRTGVIKHLKKVFEKKETIQWEVNFDIKHASESTGVKVLKPEKKWFSNIAYPILDNHGELIYVILQHEDITNRKQAEIELNESLVREQLLADIVRETSVGIAIGYPNGQLGMCNSAYQNITGYNEAELKSIDWNSVLTPSKWEKLESIKLQELHKTKKSIKYEKEYIRKDGSRVPIELLVNPRLDDKGQVECYFAFVIDITERKKVEVELKESEERFRSIVEQSPLSTQMFTPDGMTTQINRAYEIMWGITLEDLKDYNILEDQQLESLGIMPYIQGAFSGEANSIPVTEYDAEKTLGTGKKIWAQSRIYPVKDNAGKINKIILIHEDISDRKQAEAQLRKSEERFNLAVKGSNDGIWDWNNLESDEYWWSDRVYEILGYKPGEVEPRISNWEKWMHPDDSEAVVEVLNKHLEENSPYQVDFRMQKKNGNYVWIAVCGESVRDNNGKPIRMAGSFSDLTDRKQTEDALKQKTNNLTALLEISQTLTKTLNTKTVLQNIIEKAVQLIELDTGAIYLVDGQNLYLGAAVPPIKSDFPEVFRKTLLKDHPRIKKAITTGVPLVVSNLETVKLSAAEKAIKESRNMRSLLYVPLLIENHAKGVLILGTQNEIREFSEAEINMYRTMSGQSAMAIYNSQLFEKVKKLNEDLENRVFQRTEELSQSQTALLNLLEDLNEKSELLQLSKKNLEAKNKELKTFTYSVSHDLKAPLRGIDGYSRLLEENYSDMLADEGKKFVTTIREGTRQMNQLIEDLLAYSRLERSTIRTLKINIKELINTVLIFLKNEIKDISIKFDSDNCEVKSDYDALSMAIRNIIENAIKFSKKTDSPQIKIELKDLESSVQICIADNGIGFDMKYHNRIFEIFQRLNLPEQYDGTGIGLALVSKSMERIGGKVWAESSPGNGAKFYLEIPKK